ncbi:SusC/RagA family TonB-linked outer membrane protein [Bacteroides ovatus]|uniref:SusC/RagA family TonB-linked outer membrane protein n=1 Tax=Bacteroides ovatus TaxID=28116 RepID=UPI001F3AB55E|nr:SusC/RagA family TonB-linked outer membrane protein [Bacteroides ovatus]MCE8924709.1 SusC/RagA family TonB-linked outer membrane protein [Bacteroides ovatus]
MLWLFITLITFSATMQGQQSEKRISLEFKNERLADAFKKIEAASGYKFIFNYEDIFVYGVTGIIKNKTVTETLDEVIGKKPLVYKINGKFITIALKPGSPEAAAKARLCQLDGVVIDENKQPLPGAHVIIEGTKWVTTTDINGAYSFLIENDASYTIRISYLGMEMKQVKVTVEKGIANKKVSPIMLKESDATLNEVVITGYQVMNRRESASAVSSIKAADIMVQGVGSIDQMLQGTIPGMAVMNTSGEPSATPRIRIRGNATINGNKSPVWVVDGVILEQDVPFTASDINSEDAEYLIGNAISGVNPQDIESITVLKDASATAIYGVKAANGVIVVTTKKGKAGRPIITYNGNMTVNTRPSYSNYHLMNSQERVAFSKQLVDAGYTFGRVPYGPTYEASYEALMNKDITLDEFKTQVSDMQVRNTDWFDHLFRNSITQTHNVNVSGGTDQVTYYVSASYQDIQGSSKQSDSRKFTTLAKFSAEINKHISFMTKIDFTTTSNSGYATGVNPFDYAYTKSRTIPAYNTDDSYYMTYEKSGALGTESVGYNILKELENTGKSSKMDDFNALLQLNVKLIRGLTYEGTFSWQNGNTYTRDWATAESYEIGKIREYDYGRYTAYDDAYWTSALPYGGRLAQSNIRKTGYTIRNQITYNQLLQNAHHVTLMGGIETRRVAYKGFSSTGYGWIPDFGEQFNPVMTDKYIADYAEKNATDPSNTNSFTQVASFYGVGSYSYDERYILNANFRSDGSNKFGSNPKYRWLPTYSFAVKWNLMNEAFMEDVSLLNVLSLRASYGIQGNIHEDSTPYLIVTTGDRDNILGLPISKISKLPNPDLRWEKTHSWNVAVDFALLKGRIRGGLDIYGKKTSDLIMSKAVASSNGRSLLYYNAGKMTNKGFEGFINAGLLKTKDWEWRLGVNFSRNVNEITYANPENMSDVEVVNKMLGGTLAVEGAPIGSLYAYEFAGLNQDIGYPMFYTKDGKVSIKGNKSDMSLVRCGSIFPKLTGGFDTQVNYKNFSLSMNFTYSIGSVARIPDYFTGNNYYIDPLSNLSTDWLASWKQAGDQTVFPTAFNSNAQDNYFSTEQGKVYDTFDSTKGVAIPAYQMYNYSDIRVAKADFLKLKMVALSYTFPKHLISHLNISSLMLRMQVTNLFTIADKKWNGLDPETNGTGIPQLPTYSLGVNISF